MIQFTKEELISILDAFNYVKDDPAWRHSEGLDDELQAKLQSMIDNYCPHESAIPNFGILKHCADCKELVGGEVHNDETVKYNIPKYNYFTCGDVVTYKLK